MSAGSAPQPESLSAESWAQGQQLIEFLRQLVGRLAQALPATTEVVLHDLSLLPNSIVAIAGGVTDRTVGDPATDVLLRQLRSGENAVVGYPTDLPGGREGRSTTMIMRLPTGEAVAALCLNADISQWRSASKLLDSLLGGRAGANPLSDDVVQAEMPSAAGQSGEAFVRSVDELAATLIDREIASSPFRSS
ncbi:MAG: PAS domain-containing protein [Jatrophihabitans sp.]